MSVKAIAKKVADLARFFKVFKRENKYMEVRLLKTNKGTISGYFNDEEKLIQTVHKYDGAYNIFFTLNEINPDIAARSVNRMTEWAKHTTTDAEIIRRNWILIDLDPERPAGISATDEELGYAKSVSGQVENFLKEENLPEPVQAMSGNGYHLLLPVDLPNNAETTTMVKAFLELLHTKFSNEHVKVDTSTYNAARITKLYGTVACKGDSTEARPHRRSEILSIPEAITPATREQLERLIPEKEEQVKQQPKAPLAKKPGKTKGKANAVYQKIDVKKYCALHGFEIAREKEYMDGTCYILDSCPWNPEHTDTAAYIIEFPNGKVVAGCHHDSCRDENWATLLKKYPYFGAKDEGTEGKETVLNTEDMSTSEILLAEIAQAGHQFYHDTREAAYVACSKKQGPVQYMEIQGVQYRQILRQMHYERFGKVVSKDTLQQVLDTMEADAVYNGEGIELAIRSKYCNHHIYYYLADTAETVISISAQGVQVLEKSPIPFLRKQNMLEQVMPMPRESAEQNPSLEFQTIANKYWKFDHKEDEQLHHIVLLTRFISDIPSPILYYRGDHGSAKTTSMQLDKLLVDPSRTDIKALPNTINDIVAALSGEYMIGFDNLEGKLSSEISNLLCICCSGGYYSKRKLYTDNDTADVKLNAKLSFTGITTITDRADFLDRCICLSPQRIKPSERVPVKQIMEGFHSELPYLLYAAMQVLSMAITVYKDLALTQLPRMADFAQWGYAIAEVLGYGGEQFLDMYQRNQEALLVGMVEEDAVLNVLITFMNRTEHFKGTTTQLYAQLEQQARQMGLNTQHGWCKSVKALGQKLSRSKAVLEGLGIFMNDGKNNGERYRELWCENADSELGVEEK